MLQLLAPMALHSGAIGEFGSLCTGVQAKGFIIFQVMLFLVFVFKDAGCAAGLVDGELRSRSWRAWGVAPVDGQPPTASSTSTPTRAFV
jgi:hypothetical protein